MPLHAVFLRGMNVGGHRLTNHELAAHVTALGLGGVRTFRASGNLVLDAREGDTPGAVAQVLEAGLAAALGYAVPVFARDGAAVRAIAAHEPFPEDVVRASTGKLQVAFLHDAPGPQAVADALAVATPDDLLAISGTELYWLPANGVGRSELDLKTLATALGPMTVRTMGTIRELTAKHLLT